MGGAEVTSKPQLINMDEMFQKDTKALKGGEARGRQTGRPRNMEGSAKVADWHVFKPVFIQEVLEDNGRYSDTWDKRGTDAFSHGDKEDLKTITSHKYQISTLLK